MIKIKNYKKVENLEEAWELNQKRTNRIIGGMLWVKMSDANVQTAIDLSGLGLDQIEETEEEFRIGCMVTLRGERMYDFLDRLVTIAFPRVRDFRGVSGRAFDGRGNYNIGLREQIIFPEIEYDKIDAVRGMNISITTTAKTDEESKALLAGFNFPFRN